MLRALLVGTAIVALGACLSRASSPAREVTCMSRPSDTIADGVVVDREGRAVAGATVVARSVNGAACADPLAGAVVTDARGRFHLRGLAPGEYWFVALRAGGIATTPAMPIEADSTLEVTISLATEATPA